MTTMKINLRQKNIENLLKELPKSPGIYKMINSEGVAIYVGKAKELNKRVRQYFKKDYQHSTRSKKLVENISNIEVIAVDSELEAIILEHSLIKQLQPKYNVIMKDDKNYVYIKITKEDFPRIQVVRKIEKDNAKYFGPKTAAHKVKDTLKILKRIFPFRHCGLDIEMLDEKPKNDDGTFSHEVKVTNKVLKYPCIDFYIKRCIAPCIGRCNIEEYKEIIVNVEKFLNGKAEEIIKSLHEKMILQAQNKQFEKAGKTRDQIKKIESLLEKQKVSNPDQEDKDIINYCTSQNKAYFNLFQIRDGKLIGQENFILSAQDIEENSADKEVLESFVKQYYEIATDIPKEIILPHEIESHDEIENWLKSSLGRVAKLFIPKIGTKNRLLEMSLNNARIFADRQRASWQTESDYSKNAIKELQEILKLENTPKRIECYDISHLSGTETVGSMIVFENGVPKNSDYRKFKVKTVMNKPDDYKSMEEVLTRRFIKIAQDLQDKNVKFLKAKKKNFKYIESHNRVKMSDTKRDFYVLEKDKNTIGFVSLCKYSEKTTEICNIYVDKKHRRQNLGRKLVKEAIKKSKAKRLYLICKEKLKDYYLIQGFEEINKIPDELVERCNELKKMNIRVQCLAYDKNKHVADPSFSKFPDLIVIDGGKGQLGVAETVLGKMKIKIPHVALAKRLEEIFINQKSEPLILESNSEALKLLQRARDEAHRFAISYNQNLRTKKLLKR